MTTEHTDEGQTPRAITEPSDYLDRAALDRDSLIDFFDHDEATVDLIWPDGTPTDRVTLNMTLDALGESAYRRPEIWEGHAASIRAAALELPEVAARILKVKIRQAVDHAWDAIREDMGTAVSSRCDVMPVDIDSFGKLHDYVDANMYLIDAAEAVGIEWGGEGDELERDSGMDALNEISDALDAMLMARAGGAPAPLGRVGPNGEVDIEDAHGRKILTVGKLREILGHDRVEDTHHVVIATDGWYDNVVSVGVPTEDAFNCLTLFPSAPSTSESGNFDGRQF